MKFGKIDVGRYPDAAKMYGISDSSTSKQLPTVILFKHGEEITRRPAVDSKGKIARFFFTAVSIKMEINFIQIPRTNEKKTVMLNASIFTG